MGPSESPIARLENPIGGLRWLFDRGTLTALSVRPRNIAADSAY
jgi:hypothetical protein